MFPSSSSSCAMMVGSLKRWAASGTYTYPGLAPARERLELELNGFVDDATALAVDVGVDVVGCVADAVLVGCESVVDDVDAVLFALGVLILLSE